MKLKYNSNWSEDQEVEIDEACSLTEEQGLALFEQHKTIVLSDEQAAAFEAWVQADDGNEDPGAGDVPVATVAVASGVLSKAIEMEKKIDADKDINDRVRLTIKSGEEAKKGPLALCALLRAKFGAEGMAAFPDVGSPFKDPDDAEGKRYLPCNNPDRYTVQRDGKKGKVNEPHSFYQDFADRTPYGRVITAALNAIDAARDVYRDQKTYKNCKPYVTEDNETLDFPNITAWDVQALLTTWNKRRSNLATAYKQAVRVDRQIIAMSEYPGITLQIAKNKDGSIDASRLYPITIADKNNAGDFGTFTPTNFLKLDCDKAGKNGGTYADLMATVGRGKQEDKTPMAERIKSPAKAAEYIAELAAWLETDGNDNQLTVYLNQKDNKGIFTHDDAVKSLGSASEAMEALASRFNKRIASLMEAEAAVQQPTKVASK